MDERVKEITWRQFGAAIDMFAIALRDCPPELWQVRMYEETDVDPGYAEFWAVAYHALFWLDLYLGGTQEGFAPPEPFSLNELSPEGKLSPVYSKEQLLGYLDHCREKCRTTIASLTDETAYRMCPFGWGTLPFIELLVYTMRHVQEHGGQLSLFLGQNGKNADRWVSVAKP